MEEKFLPRGVRGGMGAELVTFCVDNPVPWQRIGVNMDIQMPN